MANDIASLSFDDFEELASFVTLPKGLYILALTAKLEENGFKFIGEIVEEINHDEEDETTFKVGDLVSFNYATNNETGRGVAKILHSQMQQATGEGFATVGDLVEFFSKPYELKVLVGKKAGKKLKDDGSKAWFNSILAVMAV